LKEIFICLCVIGKFRVHLPRLIFKFIKMKKFFVTVIALSAFLNVYAGGLLTNTNQSVHFLRNPARDASIEIDAVYTNPAGLAKLPIEGWHFSFSNQSAFQTRTINSTFAPFKGFGGSDTKEFKGKATALVIPSLFAAYKMDKWVFSANLGVIGGGGTAVFNDGLASFESQIAAPIAQLSAIAKIPTTYSLDAKLEGSSIIYGIQIGATYKINDMFSAFVGGRANLVNNGYVGHLRNVKIAESDNLIKYFIGAMNMANGVASNLQPAIDGGYGNAPLGAIGLPDEQINQMAAGLGMTPEGIRNLTVSQVQNAFYGAAARAKGAADGVEQLNSTNIELDSKQSGWGVTPILGFNFNWEKLNVGVKYEFITKIDVKNATKIDDPKLFPDGEKTPHDLPALLTVGAQYAVIPSVKVSAGYHHFFDSDAKMANDKQKHINGGINEFLLGAEWQINKMFLVSAGGQMTKTGVTDDYQTDMSYSLNSYSIGFGGAINVTEKIRINLAYFFTNYEDWTKKSDNYNGTGMLGTDTFSRTNSVVGIGVDFRF
jgi:hypothetical protein